MLTLAVLLPPLLDRMPKQVPHGFRAALVSPFAQQRIERRRQFVVNRNSYSLHGVN